MSFNGSGTFVVNTAGQPVVPNTVISATAFNALTADLANGLSTCITKDGQTTPTANIPMGNNKITGLAAGTAGTDAANLSQVQGSTAKLLQSVTGTDTITAAMVPALTAYAAGQMFYFVAAGDNTGAVTINIDSLGAKSVTRDGSTALVAGDIVSGEVALIVYDGTRFQLLNGNSFTNLNVSNNLTLSGGTANGVLYLNGSKVATSGSALVFDGTNLGIGTATMNYRVVADCAAAGNNDNGFAVRNTNSSAYGGSYNFEHAVTGGNSPVRASFISSEGGSGNSFMRFATTISGTLAERMRISSAGDVGIGTSSPNRLSFNSDARVETIYGTRRGILELGSETPVNSDTLGSVEFASSTTSKGYIRCILDGSANGILTFATNNTERGQFTAGGYFKASNAGTYDNATGSYHEIRQTTNNPTVLISNTVASFTGANIQSGVYGTVAGTGFSHIGCLNSAAATVFQVRGDGNAYNTNGTYGTISDERLKQDIVDADSQWDDIKAVRFRKYRMKADVEINPDTPAMFGLVAQELEQTSPGLVDELVDRDAEGNDLGTKTKSVKTSILLMKAAKALQEAMARIESLEADMAALKGSK